MTQAPTVLIALDLATQPTGPCRVGADMARRMGARVVLLYVSELPPGVHAQTMVAAGGTGFAPAAELLADEVRERVEPQLAELRRVGVEGDVWHRFGEVTSTIAACATESDALMLVIGSDIRSGLGRLFGAGFTEAIIKASPCPVLVVSRDSGAGVDGVGRVQAQVAAEADG